MEKQLKKIKAAVVGCGDRGNVYASYAKTVPEEMEIVAATDTDAVALQTTGDKYNLPIGRRFSNIDDFLKAKIECDCVIDATMDSAHYETAKKLIGAGYNLLLEKPIVNNYGQLDELRRMANEKGVSVVICHVLRYTPFYRSIKQLLEEGRIGKIETLEMNEHVGFIHFADSFVRGKWSDENVCGSGLLLQKCCHDTDLMCWLNNSTIPEKVSSFGARALFTPENAPEGAAEFCYECKHNSTCIYDAKKIHLDCDYFYFQTWRGINKPLEKITRSEKEEYLKTSDYGRCVYTLKRKLADRQIVTVAFKNGSMGTLTVTGGCAAAGREISIVGSKGEIKGRLESNKFTLYEIVRDGEKLETRTTEFDVSKEAGGGTRHSNGDLCLMRDYIRYLNGDTSSISITSINDSVNGHACIYAAEESRVRGVVESIPAIENV